MRDANFQLFKTRSRCLNCLRECNELTSQGIPTVVWHGQQLRCNLMIMQLLGPNLDDLFSICNKTFSLKTVMMLADQIIQRIEAVHNRSILHRDIKPQNFMMGIGQNSHLLYLVDFGLSKKYRDNSNNHIPYRQGRSLTGTARYSSINTHMGLEQSRRDDLESIGYLLVYLLKGTLPWQGLRVNNKNQKYLKIAQRKMSIPVQILCKGLPIEISTYINYSRSLKYQEKPDYTFLRKLFREVLNRLGFAFDFVFDWCLLKQAQFFNGKVRLNISGQTKQQQSDNIWSFDDNENEQEVLQLY